MDNEKKYEDFISTVSHELRTPLTSIRGFSQTMLSSWDKLDDESKKRFIKIIEEQSNRLIHLVENMLAVTKVQSSSQKIIYNELNIKYPIEQIISIVKNQYPNQVFNYHYEDNVPEIYVDKDKFQQIMTNLVENSAKYSYGDNVTEIKVSFAQGKVLIDVSNKGIFMPVDDCKKIFAKFARIDNPLTRKVQGSGLGLYITKSLVEKMGGSISVKCESINGQLEVGKIVFSVMFPILSIEEQARLKCNQ